MVLLWLHGNWRGGLGMPVIPDLIRNPCWLAHAVGYACWPGLDPAGEVLFFASPKKPGEKKSDPMGWEFLGSPSGAREGLGVEVGS